MHLVNMMADEEKKQALINIGGQLSLALDFIHEKGYRHIDVLQRTKNIHGRQRQRKGAVPD
jgi:hypothetical protein